MSSLLIDDHISVINNTVQHKIRRATTMDTQTTS